MAIREVAVFGLWTASAVQVFADTWTACVTTWNGLPGVAGSNGGSGGGSNATGFVPAATGGKVGNDPASIAGGVVGTLTSVPFSNRWFSEAQKTGGAIASGIVPQWAKNLNTTLSKFFGGLLP